MLLTDDEKAYFRELVNTASPDIVRSEMLQLTCAALASLSATQFSGTPTEFAQRVVAVASATYVALDQQFLLTKE